MKRLVWLVLAVFCAALGQVQAGDALGARAKPCSCCHGDGCSMPACCPPPSAALPVLETEPVAELPRPPSPRQARLAREWAQNLYSSFVALAGTSRQRRASATQRAPAANVPLFTAHCSLLI